MAQLTLAQLLGALEGSLERAQMTAHLSARDAVSMYASDTVLKTLPIPNYEFESVEFDVPLIPGALKALADPAAAATRKLATTVVLKRTRLSAADAARFGEVLQSHLQFGPLQVQAVVTRIRVADVPLTLTTDAAFAVRLQRALTDAGAIVTLEKQIVKLSMQDLVVSTDLPAGSTPMTLRIRVRPSPLRLVKDGDAPGETYLLESNGA